MIDRTNRAGETPLPNIKRTPRNTYLALARVYDLATNAVVGYIGNISTSGFMLFANEHLPNQALRILSIDLPHPDRGQVTIQVGARIAWRSADPQKPGQHNAGCEIKAIAPEDRLALLQSAKAYGVAA